MTSDVAAETGDLTRAAGDDHAIGDDRAARVLDKEVAAAIGLPHQFAGAGIQGDDRVVPAHEVDVVAVERNAAVCAAAVQLMRGPASRRYCQMRSPLAASIAGITSPGSPRYITPL